MNVTLVTGSQGFIGKHLCSYLKAAGKTIVDKDSTQGPIDVTNLNQLQSIDKADAIVHLAAKTSVDNSFQNPYETYRTNMLGTLNVLEFARVKGIRKLLFVSTYVYGQPSYMPINESHPVNPHSPYSKSKLIGEMLCKDYSDDFGIDVAVLRPFYVYGPNDRPFAFIPSSIKQAKTTGKVTLNGKEIKRDFLFVRDFISLMETVLQRFPSGYNVYNVGSGSSHTLESAVGIISAILDKKVTIEYSLGRPREISDQVADISKASTSFNWKPITDLHAGLKLTIEAS